MVGADVQSDEIVKPGISREFGYALKPGSKFKPLIDEITKMPITYTQRNLTIGFNLLPNAIDGGVFFGRSTTDYFLESIMP